MNARNCPCLCVYRPAIRDLRFSAFYPSATGRAMAQASPEEQSCRYAGEGIAARRSAAMRETSERDQTGETDISEVRRFSWMSGSIGKFLRYLVNCASIVPAAMFAQ